MTKKLLKAELCLDTAPADRVTEAPDEYAKWLSGQEKEVEEVQGVVAKLGQAEASLEWCSNFHNMLSTCLKLSTKSIRNQKRKVAKLRRRLEAQ